MTSRAPRRFTLPGILLASVAASAAACTGGDDGGGGGGSPTPTATFPADRCQLVWMNDVTGTVKDLYVLDAPVAAWVLSTAHQYSLTPEGFRGLFLRGYDLLSEAAERRAIASSGSFSLVLTTTEAGGGIGFEDLVAQPHLFLDSSGSPAGVAGTGGIGSFGGLWSDPYSQNVAAGDGEVTVAVGGTSRTLGLDLAYGVCYQGDALFRPFSAGSRRHP